MAQASRNKPLTAAERQANRLVSQERAANGHGFADLKTWRVLTKLRLKAKHPTPDSLHLPCCPACSGSSSTWRSLWTAFCGPH